jgi:hypothetical protein
MSEEFDINAGVAEIAESMGFNDDQNIDDTEENEGVSKDTEKVGQDSSDAEKEESESAQNADDKDESERKQEDEILKSAPASWAKDQHENWSKIPKEAQDYIETREKQMLDGIEQYKEGHRYAQEVDRALQPFREDIKSLGIPEPQVIYNLMTHHQALTKGSLEQRQEAFLRIGMESGIIPKEGQTLPDKHTQELEQRLSRIEQQEREIQSRYENEELQRITQTVDSFASDPKNQYFNELADDIAILLRTGLDLQTAYDKAVWANPATRAKELEKERASVIEKNKKEAEIAKKATSTNIKSSRSNGRKEAEKLGSWDDTMNDVIKSLRS